MLMYYVHMILYTVYIIVILIFCFRNHEHGSLNIFNCSNVTVRHCTFRNNTSTSYFTRKQFQGNSAGLSLGYNTGLAPLSRVTVLVTDCVFINNSADPPSHLFLSTTDLIEEYFFSGRGGGIAMLVNVTCPVDVIIKNNLLENNYAKSYGGGLYSYINGITSNQTYILESNMFISNEAELGSGAINFGNYEATLPFYTLHGTIYNCTFKHNRADTGGCLHMVPSLHGFSGNFIMIKECIFYNNTSIDSGGAIDITSYNFYYSRQHYNPVQLIDW